MTEVRLERRNTLVGRTANHKSRDPDRRRALVVEAKSVNGRGEKKERAFGCRKRRRRRRNAFRRPKTITDEYTFFPFGACPSRQNDKRAYTSVRVRDGRLKLIVSEINRFPRAVNVAVVVGLRPLFHPYIFVLFIARVLCHGAVDTCVRK